MAQRKSRIVLFIAVTFQTMVAAVLLIFTLPYFLWGPTPPDGSALETYQANAEAIVRMVAALWAAVVCVAYYFCFMRPEPPRPSAGNSSKTSAPQKEIK